MNRRLSLQPRREGFCRPTARFPRIWKGWRCSKHSLREKPASAPSLSKSFFSLLSLLTSFSQEVYTSAEVNNPGNLQHRVKSTTRLNKTKIAHRLPPHIEGMEMLVTLVMFCGPCIRDTPLDEQAPAVPQQTSNLAHIDSNVPSLFF